MDTVKQFTQNIVVVRH